MKKLISRLSPAVALALAASLAGCGGSTVINVSVGGNITGLTSSGKILTNGYTNLTVDANSTSFKFPARLNTGLGYTISILVQPGQTTCVVANGVGVINTTDVTNVQIDCKPNKILGGTVTGLIGTLELVNGADNVTVTSSDGNSTAFEFPIHVAEGFSYGVTVLTKPADQTCMVANGVGTMGTIDVGNVQVACH